MLPFLTACILLTIGVSGEDVTKISEEIRSYTIFYSKGLGMIQDPPLEFLEQSISVQNLVSPNWIFSYICDLVSPKISIGS